MVTLNEVLIKWLGQDISTLRCSIHWMDGDISPDHMVSEVVILHIQMLGSWTGFVLSCHDERATVVLKHSAVHFRLVFCEVKAIVLHFLNELHKGNAFTQCCAQCHILSFSC